MITMIAHCGEAMEAPENTLESFKRAWSNGAAQGIEGNIVCMYDENTRRNTGFEFHVWTVDNLEQGLRFAGYGVDSLTTNCPAALRRQWPD